VGDGGSSQGQRRNLSDNLLTKDHALPSMAVHAFDFTLLATSGSHQNDKVGVLRGWILIHEHSPIDLSYVEQEDIDLRGLRSQITAPALFAVAFRLYRNGRVDFRVPPNLGLRDVRFGREQRLPPAEVLRPLVAQCFYFLRDITHRHQHHSRHSDTLTTVWPADDSSLWIRETLYELYRRVIMLRRQRSPRGQEDAVGILAYVSAFEAMIAEPFRKRAEKDPKLGFVPIYEKVALRDSLNANLETKRRKRVQRNVVAAVIPAFVAAMLNLGNSIYGKDLTGHDVAFAPIESLVDGMAAFLSSPTTTMIGTLKANEWLFPLLVVIGFVWVSAFAGINQPSERRYLKGVAQAAAVWGPVRAALSMGLIAVALVVIIILLLRI
jgi:hypothetical protein